MGQIHLYNWDTSYFNEAVLMQGCISFLCVCVCVCACLFLMYSYSCGDSVLKTTIVVGHFVACGHVAGPQ